MRFRLIISIVVELRPNEENIFHSNGRRNQSLLTTAIDNANANVIAIAAHFISTVQYFFYLLSFLTFFPMLHQSLLQPCSFSIPFPRTARSSTFTIRCEAKDQSLSSSEVVSQQPLPLSPIPKLMEAEKKSEPYPGGLGPFTGRDPNVKKPEWLRQKAPMGEKFSEIRETLSQLKLNTVCEEAQCPNIGEVLFFFFNFQLIACSLFKFLFLI